MSDEIVNKNIREDLEKLANAMGVQIVEKDTSTWMKILSWILFFNRRFMKYYITTMFNRVYFPKHYLENDRTVWTVMVHELIHAFDHRSWWRMTLLGGAYIMPQILPLFFLPLAIFHSWWWLLTWVLVAPIPSYGRYWFEIRGYTGTLATLHWRGFLGDDPPSHMVDQFTGSGYYWMWPFRGMVENRLKESIKKIKDGTIGEEIPILIGMEEIAMKHLKET